MWTYFKDMPFSEGADFVLCAPGEPLAAGFRVEMGDGTATPLGLSGDGVRIYSAANHPTEMRSHASALRVVDLPDAGGMLRPWREMRIPSLVTNATTTPVAVGGLSIPMAEMTAGLYEVDIRLIARSAATNVGVRPSITGPAADLDWLAMEWHFGSATTVGAAILRQLITAFGGVFAVASAPAANTPFPIFARGYIRLATDATGDIGLSLASSSANEVALLPGGVMRVTRV